MKTQTAKKEMYRGYEKAQFPDTNILVREPYSIIRLGGNEKGRNIVVICRAVLNELNGLKKGSQQKNFQARRAISIIDSYLDKAPAGALNKGIPMENGGLLVVDAKRVNLKSLPVALEDTADDRIIATAFRWQREFPNLEVVLINNDKLARVLASGCGLKTEKYKASQIQSERHGIKALQEFDVDDVFWPKFQEAFYRDDNQQVTAKSITELIRGATLMPNQCCIFRHARNGKSVLAIYKVRNGAELSEPVFKLIDREALRQRFKDVPPQNDGQFFAYTLLLDPGIVFTSIEGKAGTGKTLLAVRSAYEHLNNGHEVISVFRPTIEAGKPLGFLPGKLAEKIEPWMLPIFDSMKFFLKKRKSSDSKKPEDKKIGAYNPAIELMEAGLLTIQPINYLLGRTFHGEYVIGDEVQNLTLDEARLVATRVGRGTKMVFTGDPTQIYNPYNSEDDNGFTHAAVRLLGSPMVGRVVLTETVRSEFADWAVKKM